MITNIQNTAKVLASLLEPVDELITSSRGSLDLEKIIKAGHFRPVEDEFIGRWFAKVLSIRQELLQIIENSSQQAGGELKQVTTTEQWQFLMLAYIAACALVRIDRYVLWEFATHKLIQRKLNQPWLEYRIPAKQYTEVFEHFTHPLLALQLNDAMRHIAKHPHQVEQLKNDVVVGKLVTELDLYQSWLDPSKLNYLKRTVQFFRHSWRRRAASAKQKSFFSLMETLGRGVSELSIHENKQVGDAVRQQAAALLRPGDVLVTRHRYALTNLFLPGTWPHTALYIGTPEQRQQAGITITPEMQTFWGDQHCTFEALKDGVHIRTLAETLAVDYFMVLRPQLSQDGINSGIERVLAHRGKRYNFDFDFFRSDRLVCTEVIYRAFDGLENMHFPLIERAGRKTLAAEDFIDLALDHNLFSIEALFGYPTEQPSLATGDNLAELAAGTYRDAPD